MRDAPINLLATREQHYLIEQAATLVGQQRSDFISEAACERAREVVRDQVFFRLDVDKFQQFTALLDVTQASNSGLERLLAVRAPWHAENGVA